MQQVIVRGPAVHQRLWLNGATVVHERLIRQALMQLARSAVTAIAVEQPLGGR